ncbi:hypothetical protein [Methylobacterium sp. Leaf88]|uniref:hypothetical protein n=1 Tax=Methylobacterium sp. Leaf88 TaxID=1736244 RepID=UPI0006F62537|nr:hypothetical protein [Methylobacterium sp. Leaf88]KQO77872.1 hypothetical protein ASF20_12925 [Methylobacterium sp. Leaf88]
MLGIVPRSGAIRLLILSNLHQGGGSTPFDPSDIRGSFDIAVIAGDCAGRLICSLAWLGERFAGTPTIYVPGNHDFYRDEGPFGFTMGDEIDAGREAVARLGIHLLSDDGCEIGGLRFFGATLWTDLRASLHWNRSQTFAEARRWMNDYRRIHRRSSTRRSGRICPEDTLTWHRRSRAFFEAALKGGNVEQTIVITAY